MLRHFLLCVATIIVSFAMTAAAASESIGPSQLFLRNASSAVTELTSFSDLTQLARDRFRATVVFFYDSADLNSWRVKAAVEAGAASLTGFTRVVAADVRNPALNLLKSAWSVATVPWIYGLGPKQVRGREEFGSGANNNQQQQGLSLLGGIRSPIPRMNQFGELTPAGIRKFGLALVADAEMVIQKVESESQLKGLKNHLRLEEDGGDGVAPPAEDDAGGATASGEFFVGGDDTSEPLPVMTCGSSLCVDRCISLCG